MDDTYYDKKLQQLDEKIFEKYMEKKELARALASVGHREADYINALYEHYDEAQQELIREKESMIKTGLVKVKFKRL